VRTAAAALLLCLLLAAPAAAAPRELKGTWHGTWTNAAVGTAGRAKLLGGAHPALRLGGPALGCAEATTLPLRYRAGRLAGSGRSIPCNDGLRWSFHARVAAGRIAGTLALRLADGTRASVAVVLKRR